MDSQYAVHLVLQCFTLDLRGRSAYWVLYSAIAEIDSLIQESAYNYE